jgi:16S rRNA (cytosine967-C5)-methyltransferase
MPSRSEHGGRGRIHRNQFEHAVALLERLLTTQAPADALMNAYFRAQPKMGSQDRSFAAETVFTVLRRWRALETVAGRSDPRALVLACLLSQGASAEALMHLTRAEDHAWLLSLPPGAVPRASLTPAVASGFPDWVYDRIATVSPEADIVALGVSLQRAAPLDLRVNPLRMTREAALAALRAEGLDAAPTPLSPLGIRLEAKVNLRRHPLFESGAIEVQDEGSQLLAYALDPKPGERVVDFCAGSGGKALLMGALMQSRGTLYAFDVSGPRLENLTPRLRRSGLSNVHPRLLQGENDTPVKRMRGTIDRVLVDAPCSGFGTLRRNPDLKWRQSPGGVDEIIAKQDRILRAAARLVKPGGRLVYATCSLLPDENEVLVRRFLAEAPEFTPLRTADVFAAHGIPLDTGDFLQLRTHVHHTDSFFAAILQHRPI